jgi:TPR repeat protein
MFEKAASLGYYAALVTLGDCYMEGKGSSLSCPLHTAQRLASMR